MNSGVRFPVGISMMEDAWFFADIFKQASTVYLSESITYNYVVNSQGATKGIDGFEGKIKSIMTVSNHLASYENEESRVQRVNSVHIGGIAGRVLSVSYKASLQQVREMLRIISENNNIIELYINTDTNNLNLKRKIAIDSVFNNRLYLVMILRFVRKISRD